MSRRWLINYLLITLIIIFTWIGNKYHVDPNKDQPKNTLTRYKPQDIEKIQIETANETIQLNKKGTNWTIQTPIQWYANNIAAERLATLASVIPQSSLPKTEIDLSTLNLRIPKAVVSLNDTSIYFGGTNNIGNRRYLLKDQTVYLTNDIHYAFISQGLTGLVDNRLLPFQLDLVELSLADIKLQKNDAGWISNNTDSNEAVTNLLNVWRQQEASNIQPYNSAQAPLKKVTAKLGDQSELEFFVLSIEPEIIIARPDLKIQYHFPKHEYYSLFSFGPPNE